MSTYLTCRTCYERPAVTDDLCTQCLPEAEVLGQPFAQFKYQVLDLADFGCQLCDSDGVRALVFGHKGLVAVVYPCGHFAGDRSSHVALSCSDGAGPLPVGPSGEEPLHGRIPSGLLHLGGGTAGQR